MDPITTLAQWYDRYHGGTADRATMLQGYRSEAPVMRLDTTAQSAKDDYAAVAADAAALQTAQDAEYQASLNETHVVKTIGDDPAPATPVVKDAPIAGTPAAIPDHLAEHFPDGTTVVAHPNGTELVANLPAEHGGFYRVAVGVEHGIEALAHKVAAFVKRVF